MTAPRGITQPPTSFIGSQCQGIHHAPLNTYNTKPKNESPTHTPPRKADLHAGIRKICITRDDNPHKDTHPHKEGRPFTQAIISMLATTIHKSNTTPHHQSGATTRTPNPPQTQEAKSRHLPPTQQARGLVVSKPNSVSGSFSKQRFPHHFSLFVVHQTPPTTGKGFLTASGMAHCHTLFRGAP